MLMFNFFLGGILCVLVVFVLFKLKEQQKFNAKNIALLAGAFLTYLIAALWANMSMSEGEIQAAMLGLLIFGGIGLTFSFLLYRMTFKALKTELNNSDKSISK